MLRKKIMEYLSDCFNTSDIVFEVKADGTAGINVFGATVQEITDALKKIDISVVDKKYLLPNNFDVHIFYSNNNKLTEKAKKSLEVFLNAVFQGVDLKDNGVLNATKKFNNDKLPDFLDDRKIRNFLQEIGFDEFKVTQRSKGSINILARFKFDQ